MSHFLSTFQKIFLNFKFLLFFSMLIDFYKFRTLEPRFAPSHIGGKGINHIVAPAKVDPATIVPATIEQGEVCSTFLGRNIAEGIAFCVGSCILVFVRKCPNEMENEMSYKSTHYVIDLKRGYIEHEGDVMSCGEYLMNISDIFGNGDNSVIINNDDRREFCHSNGQVKNVRALKKYLGIL